MTWRVTTIMSGGQTGADRGGLDAAIALDLEWGGWMPKGRLAEDGVIPEIYAARMREAAQPSMSLRTRLNIQDSDGTLLLSFRSELDGGSAFTAEVAERTKKPYLHLVLPDGGRSAIPTEVRDAVLEWISTAHISVLNVAGPRESKEPGIQAAVRDALVWIFEPAVAEVSSLDCGHPRIAYACAGCEGDFCWACDARVDGEGEVEIKTIGARYCGGGERCDHLPQCGDCAAENLGGHGQCQFPDEHEAP